MHGFFVGTIKKVLQSLMYPKKILKESGCKQNNIWWVKQGSNFFNSSSKSWLHDNDTDMYSTHNEGKSAVFV